MLVYTHEPILNVLLAFGACICYMHFVLLGIEQTVFTRSLFPYSIIILIYATSGAGTIYYSGAPEFTPGF